jgi:hypothetical protein
MENLDSYNGFLASQSTKAKCPLGIDSALQASAYGIGIDSGEPTVSSLSTTLPDPIAASKGDPFATAQASNAYGLIEDDADSKLTGIDPIVGGSIGFNAVVDDYTATTTTTGRISVGASAKGLVESGGDRDWFRLSLTAGASYRFNLNGSSLSDPTLYLRNASGGQLAYNDDYNGYNSQINFTASSSGTYFLDAGGYASATGSYTLLASNLDDYAATTASTGKISVGGNATGVVESGGDRDWFRISLSAGASYRFNLNGSSLGDPTLYLRDAGGAQLAYNDDYNDNNSQISYTASSSGTYFLDAGAYASGTGSYTLLASSLDDYGATTATAGAISVGGSATGLVESGGDRDWFRLSLTAGASYRFNLNGSSLSDPTLNLRDGNGVLLAYNDNYNGYNSQISFTARSSGTYFLDAGAYASSTGSYTLLATNTTTNTIDKITGLQDASLRQNVNNALGDNLFSHQELAALLRSTATSGVSSLELSDLQLIAASMSPYLNASSSSYTQYIFNAVVNGNTANQWWTGGGSSRTDLGNLVAGSTDLQLNRLVDKWFSGSDLPTNFVGGDTAAGAGSLSFSYGQMTGSLFVNDVSFDDINQGQAGTCYFLAAAASLANNNGQLIREMFRDNGDGSYGVRFYSSSGSELWVTTNGYVPVRSSGSLCLAGNASRSLAGEMWVALAEKAYAQANEIGKFSRSTTANSYRAIEGGLETALRHISNRATNTYSSYYGNTGWTSANNNATTWNNYQTAAISAVTAGRSLWLGSFGSTYDSTGRVNFVSGHAFAIIGYNASTGMFRFANPWGAAGSSVASVFEASWSSLFNLKGIVSWV